MTTPLATLLVELFTDPDGRAALGDDPVATLADHGWSDLPPDDLADAVRLVTANGPSAAAAAGAEIPDESSSYAEVLDGVLAAVGDVESWTPEPGPPVEAGSVAVETFDFEPAPLAGTVLDVDDPFDDAAAPEPPPSPGAGVDLDAAEEPAVDLTFAAADQADPTDDDLTLDDPVDDLDDDFGADDGLALASAENDFTPDDTEPATDEGMVDLDEVEPELPTTWGDLDDDLE